MNLSTSIGSADQFGTSYTWNNINVSVLLCDMYDQYDRFNLNLNTVATDLAASIGGTSNACYDSWFTIDK